MGIKGLARDIIMFFVGYQLLFGNMDKFQLGIILLVSAVIFTIIAFFIAFKG